MSSLRKAQQRKKVEMNVFEKQENEFLVPADQAAGHIHKLSPPSNNLARLIQEKVGVPRQLSAEEIAEDEATNSKLASLAQDNLLQGLDSAFRTVVNDRARLESEGLRPSSFALGVVNVLLSAFIAGSVPQFFWVWNTFKASTLIMYQIVSWIPMKKVFYVLDLCWIISLSMLVWGAVEMWDWMPLEWSATAFQIIFIFANGPLGWSILLLQNKLVFHSASHASTLFIHASPAISTWGLRWFGHRLVDELPGNRLSFLNDMSSAEPSANSVLKLGVVAYFIWFVPYTIWLLVSGVNLPSKGYDTVFDFNRRKMNFAKLLPMKNPSLTAQAILYMTLHALACNALLFWSILCWDYFWLQTAWLVISFLSAIYHGAAYYNYWLGKRYARAIHKLINEAKESTEKQK